MLDCVLRCQPGVEARTLHQRARLLLRILHAQHAAALAHGFQNLLQAFQARRVQGKQVARVQYHFGALGASLPGLHNGVDLGGSPKKQRTVQAPGQAGAGACRQ